MNTSRFFPRLAMSEILPEPAFAAYRALVSDHDLRKAAAGVLPPQEGLDLLAAAQASWSELQRQEAALKRGLADETTVAQQRAKYRRDRDEYERRAALQEAAREAVYPVSALLERIDRAIAGEVAAGRKSFELHRGASLKLRKGERPRDAVERARAERDEHAATLNLVRHAPRPVEESLAIAKSFVRAWADQGRVDVFDAVERRDVSLSAPSYTMPADRAAPPIGVPFFSPSTLAVTLADGSPAIVSGQLPDFGALFAWVMPDLLLQKIEAEIRLTTDESAALSTADRDARIKDLANLIVAAERVEEEAIRAAALDGDKIDRRADATPFVVLGLAIDDPRRHISVDL